MIAVVPTEKSIPYFGRKEYPTQNVKAACDFNMLFTFVLPGWEDAAYDTSIFLILFINKVITFRTHHQVCAMVNQLFIIMTYCVCVNAIDFFFLGKYYVVDFGYPMMKRYLAPYRGISYHLQEFQRRGGSPRTRHEKFNHAHSSLRCTIERIFGV